MGLANAGFGFGIFLICMATGLGLISYLGSGFVDFSEFPIPYIEYSPWIVGGIGVLFCIVSLVSLVKSKK